MLTLVSRAIRYVAGSLSFAHLGICRTARTYGMSSLYAHLVAVS